MKNSHRRDVLLMGAATLGTALALPRMAEAKGYKPTKVENGGILKGTLALKGDAPKPDQVTVSKDHAHCGTGEIDPNPLKLTDAGLIEGGIVALREVAAGKEWGAQDDPRIVQKACVFEPFVQVAPKGSELTILNEDPLLHNIHAYEIIKRARRTMFNIAQPMAGQIDTAKLKMRRGHLVEIDCDAHNWMSAWVWTSDHPYVAITDSGGQFEIGDVPPGEYELVLWHPVLGETSRDITVAANETADLALEITA